MANCIVCSKELTGRQRLYCGSTCQKRQYRHPDRWPVPEDKKFKGHKKTNSAGTIGTTHTPPSQPRRDLFIEAMLERAVREGDTLRQLKALRLRLACEIDACTAPQSVATLASRFLETVTEIEQRQTKAETKGRALDELARRRAQRQTG